MNPSKLQKIEKGSSSKNAKHAYIQPGALARGRGQSLRALGSLRVTAEQRTPIGKSRSSTVAASSLLPHKNIVVPPGFCPIEDDLFLPQEDKVMQDIQGSETSPYIQPDGLARGRGQSLRTLGSLRVTGEGRAPIEKSRSGTAAASSLLPHKNSVVPPGFHPIEDDLPLPQEDEVMQDVQESETTPLESEMVKKVRGTNRCKKVAKLKPGEKLKVIFFNNRVVGENQAAFSRHLGMLVRDGNMCPVRVHSWADIEPYKLDHMWEAVTDKFDNDDMNYQRGHVLKHMRKLWNNWRGILHQDVKDLPLRDILKSVPKDMDKGDWEWLVKEHFFSEQFKKASTTNSLNRSKLRMPHRTGSKPFREIIYELGGKDGKPPNMETIFFETHKKGDKLIEPETNEKYAEIKELVQSEPSLTNIEVVERCFGPQCKSHTIGFGGGITAKELRGGSSSSKAALLNELRAARKETESTRKENESLKKRLERIESLLFDQPASPTSSSERTID